MSSEDEESNNLSENENENEEKEFEQDEDFDEEEDGEEEEYEEDEENKEYDEDHLNALAVRAEEERAIILEERHHMTRWFYQMNRKLQKYGFLSQPSFICVQIGPLLPSKKERTDENIKDAVKLWCSKHRAVAEARYGHIRVWNTSLVTNMSALFLDERAFNDDLSRWDVSNVTSMEIIFCNASAFNGDLSRWDTSDVTTMAGMFGCAHTFNGDLKS
jgi:surface protein